MRVMVVDNGGRGQALGMKIAEEGHDVFISPGNPGNEEFAESTGIEPTDIVELRHFARSQKVGLTVVGNEMPLGMGIVDAFAEEKLPIFGPTQEQARLETDREWAKNLGRQFNVPMGDYQIFTDTKDAKKYVANHEWPLFAKLNGLAFGKGAVRCENPEEFEQTIDEWDADGLVSSDAPIVVEDFIAGTEASHHAFTDGFTQVSIPFLMRDHKTIGEGDTGPMTGGMGAVGPLPGFSVQEAESIGEDIVQPLVLSTGIKALVFTGLKNRKTLEWNVRFGDPEAQVALVFMESGLVTVLMACVQGKLHEIQPIKWRTGKAAACIVLADHGYPDEPQLGQVIEGIEDAAKIPGIRVLHIGTKKVGNNLISTRGRVLNIVSEADSHQQAVQQSYAAAELIRLNGKVPAFRRDISWD